jgi:murein DD-endopeptidase MepM/ murein hydrolase activator NlpD
MTSRVNHHAIRFLILLQGMYLGSCMTFHTKMSREIGSNQAQKTSESESLRNSENTAKSKNSIVFDWPVDQARMTRGFLPNKKRPHLGIDLAAPKGTPILASQSGVVIYAGREFRGYGKMVLVESGDGWATLYAHFDKILVAEGQKVLQGEVIGAMGRTGRATGVHLHFEIRREIGPIDPLPLLPEVATAKL